MPEWVTTKDVMQIVNCGENRARNIIKQINEELMASGYLIPNKHKIPKNRLLERLGISERG